MSLSNAKYDAIMRKYDETRIQNSKKRDARVREVNQKLPAYEALSRKAAELSFQYALDALDGNEEALKELNGTLAELSQEKNALLVSAGFPEDYLEPIYTCPDCKDTGYINDKKCHCFKQAEIIELYRQSNIADMLAKENFSVLSYDYYTDDEVELMNGIISACKSFAENFDDRYDNLLFFGNPGGGKTFLTNCITKELLDTGHSVIYFIRMKSLMYSLRSLYDIPEKGLLLLLCKLNDLRNMMPARHNTSSRM